MGQYPQTWEWESFTAEREWTLEGLPVLQASIALPRPKDLTQRSARRIHRFYRLQCRAYLRYCERQLFPRAAAECRRSLEASQPLPCCRAELTYHVTCCRDGLWSLYTENRERVGSVREVLRRGDTWDLRAGYPLSLASFFPRKENFRATLLALAEAEIRRQEAEGTARYHEKWRRQLRRTFNRENYYLTDGGIALFWQMHALAPAAEGTPTFLLPWGEGRSLCPWGQKEAASPEEGRCRDSV